MCLVNSITGPVPLQGERVDPGKRELHWILQSQLQLRELGRTPGAAVNKPTCEYGARQWDSRYCPFLQGAFFYEEVKLHQDARLKALPRSSQGTLEEMKPCLINPELRKLLTHFSDS